MPSQNPRILKDMEAIADRYRQLFFNKKSRITKQVFYKNKKKPYWGYLPVELDNQEGCLIRWLRSHFRGDETLAFYSHSDTATCKWMCIDIDVKEGLFLDRMAKAAHALGMIRQRVLDMGIPPESILMDFSGSKGYHVWVVIEESPMTTAQNFLRHIINGLGALPHDIHLDVFPNPNTDPAKSPYGYPVKLPCGLHKGVSEYSHFVDENLCGVMDVLSHLSSVSATLLPELPILPSSIKPKHSRKPKKPSSRPPKEITGSKEPPPVIEQPPMTDRLLKIFKGCDLLRSFKERPDLAGYHEWMYSGLLLASIGEDGCKWFEFLSSQDANRFDGSHTDVIAAVKDRGYHPPLCKTIGCSHCGQESPLQLLRVQNKRYKIFREVEPGATREKTAITLVELQDELRLKMQNILASGGNKIYLNTMPLGTGKTTITVDEIKKSGKRCLFYCPTHELSEVIVAKFGHSVIRISGLDRMQKDGFTCPHKNEIADYIRLGLSNSHFCGEKNGVCFKQHDCEYLKQFTEAAQADAVILVHDHLHLGDAKKEMLLEDRRIAVIDEAFLRTYRQEQVMSRSDIENLGRAVRDAFISDLRITVRELTGFMSSSLESLVLAPFHLHPCEFTALDKHFRKNLPGARNITRIIYKAAKERLKIRKAGADILSVNIPMDMPESMPIVILDATATASDYELLLGRSVVCFGLDDDKRLASHAKIIQVVSGSYTNGTLLDKVGLTDTARRIVSFIQNHVRDAADYGIICTKKIEEHLVNDKIFPPEKILHFNALRGLNDFSGVKDLFIVGYQGISYRDLAKMARVLFDQHWSDDVMAAELETQKDWLTIKTTNEESCSVLSLNPQNPFIRVCHRLSVQGEVEQAIGRARIYSDCGKPNRKIFLITNIPTTAEIAEVIELPDTREKPDKLVRAARQLLDEHGAFSRKQLAKKAGMSERQIRKVIGRLMVNLGLVEATMPHNQRLYRKGGQTELPHSIAA